MSETLEEKFQRILADVGCKETVGTVQTGLVVERLLAVQDIECRCRSRKCGPHFYGPSLTWFVGMMVAIIYGISLHISYQSEREVFFRKARDVILEANRAYTDGILQELRQEQADWQQWAEAAKDIWVRERRAP